MCLIKRFHRLVSLPLQCSQLRSLLIPSLDSQSSNNHCDIALFDSGVGGFSIMEKLKKSLPRLRYAYFNDNGFHPYGTKSPSQVIDRSKVITEFLIKKHSPAIVIVACNTASTLALKDLRQSFPNLVFVGVVPAVKPAAQISINKKIAVLATPRTISGAYLDKLIKDFAEGPSVLKIALPQLVEMVEADVRGITQDWSTLARELLLVTNNGCDTVVLGCTHYPLVLNRLQKLCPNVENWIDSSDAITKRVESLLQPNTLDIESADVEHPCYFSKSTDIDKLNTFLKRFCSKVVVAKL